MVASMSTSLSRQISNWPTLWTHSVLSVRTEIHHDLLELHGSGCAPSHSIVARDWRSSNRRGQRSARGDQRFL